MSLRSALRKAAGLIVEMPEEESLPQVEAHTPVAPRSTPDAGTGSRTDKMWEELEQEAKKMNPTSGPLAQTKTVEQIARESNGPSLDQIKVAPEALSSVSSPDGAIDFNEIYRAASLPTVPFTSEQVLEMLNALPAELPLDTRRQMIRVSINSMGRSIGATPENIVADASRKLAALMAYTEHQSQMTSEYVTLSEQKIAVLQSQIEETRQAIAAKQEKLTRETQGCTSESHRLDEVLEFFSLDVPPSKYAANEAQPSP